MRPRGSITAPLVLIAIGILFLIHAISPDFQIGRILTFYWPYILIAWGVISLVEISIRFLRGAPLPMNGISGGMWGLVVVIVLVGLSMFELRHAGGWWQNMGFHRGMEAFGADHEYSLSTQQRTVARDARIVIEAFRGDAKIVGTDATDLTVSGHKNIRAFEQHEADEANTKTPVEVLTQGKTIIIRMNQDRSSDRIPVTTTLELAVPRGVSIEATGTIGDFDISSINGDIDLSSGNAGVRVQDIGGRVRVETRRSDLIRCTNVKGPVDLHGHGQDVELDKIGGQVTINGDYMGTVSLRELAKQVRVQGSRTKLDVEQVPGEIRLDRGNLSLDNVIGPVKLSARASDVSVSNFSNGLELTVDRGDIQLRPGQMALGKMAVHAKSGDIELILPQTAHFVMSASTQHGEIDNQFGESLRQSSAGRGARLEGSVGDGPDVNLVTGRGTITVRKTSGTTTKALLLQPIPAAVNVG